MIVVITTESIALIRLKDFHNLLYNYEQKVFYSLYWRILFTPVIESIRNVIVHYGKNYAILLRNFSLE